MTVKFYKGIEVLRDEIVTYYCAILQKSNERTNGKRVTNYEKGNCQV